MLRLNSSDPGFAKAFQRLVADRRESDDNVARDVARILDDVRNRGDAVLAELTQRYDGHQLVTEHDWQISSQECRQAYDELLPDLRAALELAAQRIRGYHEAQKPADRDAVDADGVRLGARWLPVDAAGLYVDLAEGEAGVAPGQACALYSGAGEDARVYGGGFIARSEREPAAEAVLKRILAQPVAA